MDNRILLLFFAALITVSYGTEPTNYDLSRQNKVNINNGFSLRDVWDFLLGAGYGYPNYQSGGYNNYPGNYPTGPGLYPGQQYPGGSYPGGSPGLIGPPGAHPGCPLCDSSVYSYCYRKQAHDACCCDQPSYLGYGCRKTDCNFLHANSCQEYRLISNCCCVDLQKNSIEPVAPIAVVG